MMKAATTAGSIVIAVSMLALSQGCTTCSRHANQTVKAPVIHRYGTITGLKPEKIARYKELHAACWPGVLAKLKTVHVQNYSIYLKEIDGKTYLFSYFEYTGADFAGDMAKMAADPETKRWWQETDPCQQPLPAAAAKKEIWDGMEEVFHMD